MIGSHTYKHTRTHTQTHTETETVTLPIKDIGSSKKWVCKNQGGGGGLRFRIEPSDVKYPYLQNKIGDIEYVWRVFDSTIFRPSDIWKWRVDDVRMM